MKKTFLTLLLAFLLLFTLAVSVMAYDALPKASEKEFSVASFHGTKAFLTDLNKPQELEDAAYWLVDNKAGFNLKYVSYLGQISGSSNYKFPTHANTAAALAPLCAADEEWIKEFKGLLSPLGIFKDEGIPAGVTYGVADYYGNGLSRNNNQAAIFPVVDIMPDGVTYDYYDDSNYYTIVENNGIKYIIYQLEMWPQEPVLNWFNDTLSKHPDKYCIVFTYSMIDADGSLYTMWDWEETGGKVVIAGATSMVRAYNLANSNRPRDGEILWKYAFSKHDNILAVITSYLTTDEIVMTKKANANGVETAIIGANITGGLDKSFGAMPLITKFSEDNKTITCYYTIPIRFLLKEHSSQTASPFQR